MTLADWLKQNGRTATWLASQVGRDPSFITRIKNGDAMPSVAVVAHIQRITGNEVTAIDFVDAKGEPSPSPAEAGTHHAGAV